MTNDLTVGSPLKQIIFFSIPFLIGNLFQQFYNIVDMIIVGRVIDINAYAAVGATSSLVWFACGAIQALTVGFSVIAANYFGSQDEQSVKRAFGASIRLTAIISIVLTAVCVIFAMPMLEIMQTPPDIIDSAYRYIVWMFLGLAVTAFFNLLSNMIRAIGDSRTPLYFLIIACVINIILDYVFMSVFGMDTDGAGLATVIAQLISAILCLIYIALKHPILHIRLRHLRMDYAMDKKLIGTGVPMAFLNMVLSVGSVVMQFVTNGMGTLYVSAQTTGAKLLNFFMQPFLAFGSAIAVFAAQNYGAKKYGRISEATGKTLIISFVWVIISTAITVFFGKFCVELLTGSDVDQAIVDGAYKYGLISTALMFFLAPLIIIKSVLQSVERNLWTTVSGFTEIIGRAGIAAIAMALISTGAVSEDGGFLIICFGNPLAWVFGLVTIIFDYISLTRKFKRLTLSEATDS